MSSRAGYIFHENFVAFSPLLYVGNHKNPFIHLKDFCVKYWNEHKDDRYDGRKFACDAVMVDFINHIELRPQAARLFNLSNEQIEQLKTNHDLPNFYDEGCWLIDVSHNNFGNVSTDSWKYMGDYNILNIYPEDFPSDNFV